MEAREASLSEDLGVGEGSEWGMVGGGLVWDQHCDCQQLEALNHAVHASCELGFEKVGKIFFASKSLKNTSICIEDF